MLMFRPAQRVGNVGVGSGGLLMLVHINNNYKCGRNRGAKLLNKNVRARFC